MAIRLELLLQMQRDNLPSPHEMVRWGPLTLLGLIGLIAIVYGEERFYNQAAEQIRFWFAERKEG